ncbi:helix-turn-helix domain-containing protein [Staphylococcus shinii]|uniref:helix-turn-helix domain-containing protein n=1 Tax=Staphylococcus shinii TaxID=2912228 RepID=UPI00192D901B|nr:helix-turn-helix transcriptional regulator [Staphylococcus shinii]QRA18115.1 helix-turn-helix transcriptional regulator [Staphylococcus shinii]
MEIDKELKRLRKENNITQEYLAKKLYVSIQTINKWENGKCLPDAINLLHIAQFYGISLDVLMKNEIPKNMKGKDAKKNSVLKEFFNNLLILKSKKT